MSGQTYEILTLSDIVQVYAMLPAERGELMLGEITDVRVERLNAISEADAMAEGIARFEGERFFHWEPNPEPSHPRFNGVTPEAGFQFLWETINGDGSWDANPWVWAVSFRVIPNPSIDNGAADAARA